jgi:hypothetical protein
MKKLLLSICVAIAIICFAACGTTQSTAAQLSNQTTNTTTQSDLFKAGEQLGAALKFFYDQKATNGKINYEDPTTYLQMAVIVQNAKIIKANYKDKAQYATLVEGLKAKSGELINEKNVDTVVNTLVEKIANSEAVQKTQSGISNTQNWVKENQDTIDAINVLLNTLK